jgi:hypothetical protein
VGDHKLGKKKVHLIKLTNGVHTKEIGWIGDRGS